MLLLSLVMLRRTIRGRADSYCANYAFMSVRHRMSLYPLHTLSTAIDEVGGPAFPQRLLKLLESQWGVNHVVLYRYSSDGPEVIGAASSDGSDLAGVNSARYRRDFWRRDTCYSSLIKTLRSASVAVSCVRSDEIDDSEFRHALFHTQHLAGRALVIGDKAGHLFGLSMFRTDRMGFFVPDELATIRDHAGILVSLLSTHQRCLPASRPAIVEGSEAFAQRLEEALRRDRLLTARESAVCIRLVLGRCIKDIARELDISVESVTTYRKRAFVHLGISSREELVRVVLGMRSASAL